MGFEMSAMVKVSLTVVHNGEGEIRSTWVVETSNSAKLRQQGHEKFTVVCLTLHSLFKLLVC